MAEKDNANPIVHAQTAQPVLRRGGKDGADQEEWWRDASVHAKSKALLDSSARDEYDEEPDSSDDSDLDPIDNHEIFDLIRSISDPEHPLTLEQLAVVNADHVTVDEGDAKEGRLPTVLLEFTPTIPHCSMATLIGLSLRVRLLRALPARYKVDIRVRPGTHQSENAVNKQLNDKERVAAALENAHLLDVVQNCLATAQRRGRSEEEVAREIEEVAQRLGVAV